VRSRNGITRGPKRERELRLAAEGEARLVASEAPLDHRRHQSAAGAADPREPAPDPHRSDIPVGVPLRSAARPTPLRTRNYRLYFSGQLVSVPGTWLQTVAQAWLVLQLSASGSALG